MEGFRLGSFVSARTNARLQQQLDALPVTFQGRSCLLAGPSRRYKPFPSPPKTLESAGESLVRVVVGTAYLLRTVHFEHCALTPSALSCARCSPLRGPSYHLKETLARRQQHLVWVLVSFHVLGFHVSRAVCCIVRPLLPSLTRLCEPFHV